MKAKHSPEITLMVSETKRRCIRREEHAEGENIVELDIPMNKTCLENNFCFPPTLACKHLLERSFQEKPYSPTFTLSIHHQEDVKFPPGHGLFSSALRCGCESYPQTISFPLHRRIAEVSQCWKDHRYNRRAIRAKIWLQVVFCLTGQAAKAKPCLQRTAISQVLCTKLVPPLQCSSSGGGMVHCLPLELYPASQHWKFSLLLFSHLTLPMPLSWYKLMVDGAWWHKCKQNTY